LQPGDTVPAVPLIDQDGRHFTLQDSRGEPAIVTFIYTRCADARMCPLVSAKYARMQHDAAAAHVRLVEITLDPTYDTPSVMHRYGVAYGADARTWTLATGSTAAVDELAARFGIATARVTPTVIAHSEAAIVLDPHARIASVIDGAAWDSADVLGAARQSAGGSPGFVTSARLWFAAAAAQCGSRAAAFSGAGVLGVLALSTAVIGTLFVRALRT
jgi:cytochrome oxidase Cu insertion factor (SCO1/SenC/PrrC family)